MRVAQEKRDILMVEENKPLAAILMQLLQNQGYKVDCADSYMQSLEYLKTHSYQTVVSNLKSENPEEFLQMIRRFHKGMLIVTSTYSFKELFSSKKPIKSKVERFIKKPFALGDLLSLLPAPLSK